MFFVYDKVYLKSILAILKLLQIVVLLIGFAAVLSFDLEVIFVNTTYSRLRFFVLVTSVAWFTAILIFVLNLFRLTRNLPVPWHWVNLITGVIFSIFLLISSGLLTSNIKSMRNSPRTLQVGQNQRTVDECTFIDSKKSATSCSVAELGAVCGFIAVALFVADVVVSSQKLRKGDYSHDGPMVPPHVDNATVSSVVQ